MHAVRSCLQCSDEAVKEALEAVEEKYRPLPYSTPNSETKKPSQKHSMRAWSLPSSMIFSVIRSPAYTVCRLRFPKSRFPRPISKRNLRNCATECLVVEKATPADNGDIVTLDYVELDTEGKEMEATERKDLCSPSVAAPIFIKSTPYNRDG